MSIIKIDNIYFYSGILSDNIVNSTEIELKQKENSLVAKKWLTDNNIPIILMNYGDPAQWPSAIAPLNTWFNDTQIETFPFVIYDEIDENFNRTKRVLLGVDEIINSNLIALIKLSPKVVL